MDARPPSPSHASTSVPRMGSSSNALGGPRRYGGNSAATSGSSTAAAKTTASRLPALQASLRPDFTGLISEGLLEIEECRPFFIGLIGAHYDWLLPAEAWAPWVGLSAPWTRHHETKVISTYLKEVRVLRDARLQLVNLTPPWILCSTLRKRVLSSSITSTSSFSLLSGLKARLQIGLHQIHGQTIPALHRPSDLCRHQALSSTPFFPGRTWGRALDPVPRRLRLAACSTSRSRQHSLCQRTWSRMRTFR
jgi:hypothetical protein